MQKLLSMVSAIDRVLYSAVQSDTFLANSDVQVDLIVSNETFAQSVPSVSFRQMFKMHSILVKSIVVIKTESS